MGNLGQSGLQNVLGMQACANQALQSYQNQLGQYPQALGGFSSAGLQLMNSPWNNTTWMYTELDGELYCEDY